MAKRCCWNCVEWNGGKCWVDLPPWATAYADKNNRPPIKPDDGADCELFIEPYEGN